MKTSMEETVRLVQIKSNMFCLQIYTNNLGLFSFFFFSIGISIILCDEIRRPTKVSHDSILEINGFLSLRARPLHPHPTQAIPRLHHLMERQPPLRAALGPLLRRAVRPQLRLERLRFRHVVRVAAVAPEEALRAQAFRRRHGPAAPARSRESRRALRRREMALLAPFLIGGKISGFRRRLSGRDSALERRGQCLPE